MQCHSSHTEIKTWASCNLDQQLDLMLIGALFHLAIWSACGNATSSDRHGCWVEWELLYTCYLQHTGSADCNFTEHLLAQCFVVVSQIVRLFTYAHDHVATWPFLAVPPFLAIPVLTSSV